MKRTFLSVVLLLMFALCFTACSSGTPSDTSSLSSSKQESAAESETGTSSVSEEPEEESSEPAEESNILIAYFSHSGNTKAAAEQIAALTGGTLAEIERVEEYGDLEAEAEAEILNGDRPEITVDTDNISDYDIVFVGYPIWWDEAPAMISTFLANNDFAGKTIVPFCTSASDDIENSLHIFNELCPNATIAEGIRANNEAKIEPWLQGLGIIE
ncbi:flavodoxin [Hydrogeniiclostridium mannosilyticum]|uniref:Flavodoxin n=1 Tax=Hydrogeniiclostridium mannosilyticum TaxID=2764322 RepID=A0A328UF51_9FIRM|nr:flavodoxin [Hydrogeniiclostridium mannosilyticum]RAQ30138.1 flavodoxin [Hydrogeniiclostridium mannosilyticum]